MNKKITIRFKITEFDIETEVIAESEKNYILQFSKEDLCNRLIDEIVKSDNVQVSVNDLVK